MVTAIQLGNISTVNGKTTVTGGATGFDVQQLVKDLTEARRIPITLLEDKVDLNTRKLSAFNELANITRNFETALDFLRSPPGLAAQDKDVFLYRTVTLGGNTPQPASNYVDVVATPGTNPAEYTVEVQALATRTIQTTGLITGVSSLNDPAVTDPPEAGKLNQSTMTLAPGIQVSFAAGDSLNDVLSKINAVSQQTGVTATAIKVGADSYRLQFQANQVGVANGFDFNIPENTGAGGFFEMVSIDPALSQVATDAQLKVNGIDVTSTTNSVTGVVEGLTFNLKAETPIGMQISASVKPDVDLVINAINNMVNVYNEMRVFVALQNERDEGGILKEEAVLANNPVLRTIRSQIDSVLGSLVSGIAGNNPASLPAIGITYTDFQGDAKTPAIRNVLQVDEAKLRAALNSNFDGVRKVFAFDFQSNNPDLFIASRTNAYSANDFTLNIDVDNETVTATYMVGGNPMIAELDYEDYGGGIRIIGRAGTPFEGLTLVYANTVSATINVSTTQGLADRMYNTVRGMNSSTGILTRERESLASSNERINKDIERQNLQVEDYRTMLLRRFSLLEQTLAQVNTLLRSIQAQIDARNAK